MIRVAAVRPRAVGLSLRPPSLVGCPWDQARQADGWPAFLAHPGDVFPLGEIPASSQAGFTRILLYARYPYNLLRISHLQPPPHAHTLAASPSAQVFP